MTKKMTYLVALFLFTIQIQASGNSLADDPCLPPINIEVTAITTYSIEFEWEGAGESDPSTLFQYTITEDQNPLGGPTTIENQAASTGYMPLSPSTTYNLYLRTLCMGVWSDWSDAVSFTTAACDTVDMPYFQDFETLTSFNLVECTGGEVISGNYWNVNQTATDGFNGNTLSYSANETQDANSWYIIQSGINITEDDKIKVSFKYGGDGNGSETIRLFMATSIDDFTSGDGLQISDLAFSDDTVNEYVAGPIPFTSTDVYYFAFQVLSDANQGTIYVDDFKVEEWTCGVPEEITADDISADSVTLSWDATGNNQVNFYQYTISTSPDEPDSSSDIIATGSAINNLIENLDSNTVYYVYVRASCSGVWSDWSQSISFVTLCDTSSVLLPVGLAEQTLTEGQTLGNLAVEGENLTWYADQELTIEIPDTTVAQDGITYYVTQTIEGCISEALAITVEITLSRGSIDKSIFRAYPNPVTNILSISCTQNISNVYIINMLGQTVVSQTVNAQDVQVNMSELPTGNYVIKIIANDTFETLKIVKQ